MTPYNPIHASVSASPPNDAASSDSSRSRMSEASSCSSIVTTRVTKPPGTAARPRPRHDHVRQRLERLLRRQIRHALVRGPQVFVPHVTHDADDFVGILYPLSREADTSSEWIVRPEIRPRGARV